MHAEHRRLLTEIEAGAGDRSASGAPLHNDSYLDSGHPIYFVRVPERRRIARAWLAATRACRRPRCWRSSPA